jgi:hypothetical protein
LLNIDEQLGEAPIVLFVNNQQIHTFSLNDE